MPITKDSVGCLLSKIGDYKLCSPEEELELSQFIFNNKYLLNIEDTELSPQEVQLKNTTKRKLDELVNRNLRIVKLLSFGTGLMATLL
ncbi:MAG: hypothetical protein WBM86_32025 [Waterburya sp.]